ncbi:MAG TPA: iron-containing alcohol dehydrogenase, partial [Vicinamibacterales bacterium]|nr:iron-containing alcohol dehydrogenase [Vicinamibacterales bacterium]
AAKLLDAVGIVPFFFHNFGPNPDTAMVEEGRQYAAAGRVDGIVALGGGSSLDCAKGINMLFTNGGSMRDYRGHGKAVKPMLPSIGVPTTAGTGSEAQSFAIISDAETHAKMACGDDKAAFRIVILDAALTVTQPRDVTAIAGYDAISHAVEAFATRTRTPSSQEVARQAWRLLEANYERVLEDPADLAAREAMLLGAHRAGAAIEMSMLGATHACANPLTAKYGTTHGIAIAVMLPHVVRWNAEAIGSEYAQLWDGDLPARLDALARAAGLPRTLSEIGVSTDDLGGLSADAATQWTGQHNPRPFSAPDARMLYERAL